MPEYLKAATVTKRVFLTWFVARDGAEFTPENFPVFIRIHEDRSMYGAPAVDGVSVKATLDGRGRPTPNPDAVPRDLTPAEITETTETVTEFFPGLYPSIVRTDAFPDLFTTDGPPPRPTQGRQQDLHRNRILRRRLQKRHRIRRNRRPRSPRQTILRGPGIRPAPTLQLTTARSPDFSFNY